MAVGAGGPVMLHPPPRMYSLPSATCAESASIRVTRIRRARIAGSARDETLELCAEDILDRAAGPRQTQPRGAPSRQRARSDYCRRSGLYSRHAALAPPVS